LDFKFGKQNLQFFSSGVNFTNILRTAFTNADPKSRKKTDGLTVFFALLGSAHIKAAHKMLVKSTQGGEEEQQTPYGIIDESIHKR